MLGFEYWFGDLELDSVLKGEAMWGAEGHVDAFPAARVAEQTDCCILN